MQHNGGQAFDEYVRGLLGFAVVFNIGDLYYQQQLQEKALMQRDKPHGHPSYISISLHLFLSMAILFFAAGIKLVYDNSSSGSDDHEGGGENGEREEALLLCTSAAASIVLIFCIRIQHKGALVILVLSATHCMTLTLTLLVYHDVVWCGVMCQGFGMLVPAIIGTTRTSTEALSLPFVQSFHSLPTTQPGALVHYFS